MCSVPSRGARASSPAGVREAIGAARRAAPGTAAGGSPRRSARSVRARLQAFASGLQRPRPTARGLLLSLLLLPILPPSPAAAAVDTNDEEEAERTRLEAELAEELGAPAAAPAPRPAAPAAPSFGARLLPDISLVGTFLASHFSDEPTARLEAHEPWHRGPAVQELELGFRSNIDPHFRADVFLALSPTGIEIEEAYVTTLALPGNLQLRAGSLYAPFGRFNQQHFLEVTPFVDMPLPNRRFFGGEQLRGVGAEASVLLPLPFYLELRGAALTAGNEVSFGVPGSAVEDLHDLLLVGRLLASFDLGERLTLNLGTSAANGPNASGGLLVTAENRTDVLGADLYLHLRDPASIAYTAMQAEWLFRRATVPGGRLEQGGLYVWLVRRFDRHLEAALRYDRLGPPDGKAHGAPAVSNDELAGWLAPAEQQRIGAALSWYFSEFSRLRLQANRDFGLATDEADTGPVTELFLQFQFAIGAHGAHPF